MLIRNVGRHPTSVQGYAARLDNGISFGLTSAPHGCPQLPHRLEPHSQALYYLELAEVIALLKTAEATNQPAREVAMTVDLGSGKTLTTKEVLQADELTS